VDCIGLLHARRTIPAVPKRNTNAIAKRRLASLNGSLLGLGDTRSRYDRSGEPCSYGPTQRHHPQFRFRFCTSAVSHSGASGGASSNAAGPAQTRLTHMDETGRPAMVDISTKVPTRRTATASGRIYISKFAYDLITTSPVPVGTDMVTQGVTQGVNSPELEKAKTKTRSKGDVLTVAQLAAIMGCKRTADLIPLCHPLPLTNISVRLLPESHIPRTKYPASVQHQTNDNEAQAIAGQGNLEDLSLARPSHYSVMCQATVSCEGKTGVEMEALMAVSVGLLTVWDMLKAVAGKEMAIGEIIVDRKEGGKSGDFVRTHITH